MIKKVFLFLVLIVLQLSATHYNSTVLELEAKLFPKIILLSEQIDKKAPYLDLYIITEDIDRESAQDLKYMIEDYYPKKISNKTIRVSIKEFSSFKKRPDALIVLYHNAKELTQIALWANKNNVISLAYDPSYMEYGIMGSLYVGKVTKPYLNRAIMQKYNFKFNPYLLKLSKFR